MAKFKVGDVCIIVKCDNHPELLGKETTILGEPKLFQNYKTGKTYTGYLIDLVGDNGLDMRAEEHQLKLKKFKGEEEVMRMFSIPIKTNEKELA